MGVRGGVEGAPAGPSKEDENEDGRDEKDADEDEEMRMRMRMLKCCNDAVAVIITMI